MRTTHDYLDDKEIELIFDEEENWENLDVIVDEEEDLSQEIDLDDEWIEDNLDNFPSEDGLDLYFRQMSQQPLLSAEQEISLARSIEQGKFALAQLELLTPEQEGYREELLAAVEAGKEARKMLIQANTRLVVSIAKKYRNRGLPFLDLIQEGNIGLIIAVRKYDYHRGNRFSTYATWWIRQSVSRSLANYGRTIRIPSHMHSRISKLYRVLHDMEQVLGRPPELKEVAAEMQMEPNRVYQLLQSASQPISLEQRVGDDKDTELADFIADTDSPQPSEVVSENMLSAEMEALLDKLSPREAGILRLRYGLNDAQPRTLKEVGRLYGLSRERIRQLERSALHKLRSPNIGGDLWQYLSY